MEFTMPWLGGAVEEKGRETSELAAPSILTEPLLRASSGERSGDCPHRDGEAAP